MSIEGYKKAMMYEVLMCRALKSYEGSIRKGTDSSVYENLFHINEGLNCIKGNTYEKQFEKIRQLLLKGLDAFLKRKLESRVKLGIEMLKLRVQDAHQEPQLYAIIEEALELTMEYKEF